MELSKAARAARKVLPLKSCGAVIVAAGTASRMGGIDKVMAPLGGEPMIVRTVRAFQDCEAIREIVIVTREDLILQISELCREMDKVKAVVKGGGSRQESVWLGLNALSNAMFSGTDAALTYDSLKQAGQEERYLSVAANRSQIGMLASALGSLASTLRRFLRFSGFYLVSALFSSISTLAMLLLKEPVVTEAQAARSSHSLRELPGQFAQLVWDSAAALRGCPLAAKLIAADAFISIPCYLTKMFLQQRLVELGWPTEWLFLPLLLGGAACVAGTEIGRRVHPHTLRRFYTVCALLVGGGTFLVGAAPAWGGILGMMLVQGVLEVWLLHADQRLNALISSDQRATLISVDSMAYSILMIPASPFVGAVGDLFGQAGAGLALLGVLTAASGAAVLAKRRS